MYTVAITPVLVGSAAAALDTGRLSLAPVILYLTAAVLVIAWLNLCNDVFDHATGVDKNKAESIVNLLGGTVLHRYLLLLIAHMLLGIASLLFRELVSRIDPASASAFTALMGIAVFGGYAYQGPPFRLGYLGLGEPICYVAWSLAVAAAYLAQNPPTPPSGPISALGMLVPGNNHTHVPATAFLVAAPTTLILLCSHFHQHDDDARVGKQSPIVRLGTRSAATLVRVLVALFLMAHHLWSAFGALPREAAFLPFFAATPSAIRLRGFVRDFHDKPHVVRKAKYIVVKMHFVHGIALTTALIWAASRRHPNITITW